ncbi:MAG TPA: PIG-L family deacetylase [Dehalococcoidia bacterium]|nr:PIG-L family deacetylase [Dehalococcoidia bacterium]
MVRPGARGAVLVATAHPDDETLAMGGTLAWLAHYGWQVTIVCATRGERGWIADPLLSTRDALGLVREQELRRAAQVLGAGDVCLLDFCDGTLSAIDRADLAGAFAAAIRRIRPQLVFTWGPDGGYGHPDHVAVCRAVTAAFQATARGQDDRRALYYFSVRPPAIMRGLRWLSHRLRRRPAASPPFRTPEWTTAIDVSAYRKARLEALRQHRTQIPADVWLRGVAALLAPRNHFAFSSVERFHRAYPPLRPGEPHEIGFWQQPRSGVERVPLAATRAIVGAGAPAIWAGPGAAPAGYGRSRISLRRQRMRSDTSSLSST